jgi:drug/metabolite transporter (DMT)-like permease
LGKSRQFIYAHASLLMVALFYSINYFTIKPIFEAQVDSFALLAIRCFSVSLVLLACKPFFSNEKIKGREDWILVGICALLGVTLNQTFFLWGVSETSRVNSSVLMITSPVFVLVAAWFMGTEKINWRKIAGILASFLGAAGLIWASAAGTLQAEGSSLPGDIKITLNAALYGVYLVLVRPLLQKYQTMTVITAVFVVGSIPNVMIGTPFLLETDWNLMDLKAVWGIVFLVLFATIAAYFLNAWAMKAVPASSVGAYVYIQPVFVTVVSACAGFGEVSWSTIPLILLIFAGVYLVTMPGRSGRAVNGSIPRNNP